MNNYAHFFVLPEQELKKHSRTSPDLQIKEFPLTKQKTRPRTDYEWIAKTI